MNQSSDILSRETMRNAVASRDEKFDGQFFFAVITTGIYCKPSCPSRAAKTENLRFFRDVTTATVAGFRACKRCKPGKPDASLKNLVAAARYIEKHADEKITLKDLATVSSLSVSQLQRKFKATFGVTPKAYHDRHRLEHFKTSLKSGDAVTDAIYSSGFGSPSRVYGEAMRNIGMTPGAYRAGGTDEIISYAHRNTALGVLLMAATDRGVCFAQFGKSVDALIAQLHDEFPKADINPSPAGLDEQLDRWVAALDDYLQVQAPRPDLPLDLRGTAFQIKVWKFLLSSKEGDVYSYGELAKGIDKPKATRAAATACGANRIAVLVPCHRVLRGDGSIGGYRWGIERKRSLLDIERAKKSHRK